MQTNTVPATEAINKNLKNPNIFHKPVCTCYFNYDELNSCKWLLYIVKAFETLGRTQLLLLSTET